MNNISKLLHWENLFEERQIYSEKRCMPGPERNALRILRGLLKIFSNPGHLVFDHCLVTFSTAKAFILKEKHRKFIGCDADIDCVEKLFPSLLVTFARQVLNKDSAIEEGPKFEATARKYVRKMSASESSHDRDF